MGPEGYRSAFNSVAKDIMSLGFQEGPAQERVDQTPTVTDISNKNFHLPNVSAVKASSVQSAGAKTVDTKQARGEVQATKQDYMNTDQEIKNTVYDEMKSQFGAKDTAQVSGQLGDGGHHTKLHATAVMLDPTGVAGSVYEILSSIRSEMKGLPDSKVNEMLDKTLSNLRSASEAQQGGNITAAQAAVPEHMDFSEINWSELKEFLDRNPENDPIMRAVEEIEVALDNIDHNNAIIEGHDHRSGDLKEKAIFAVEHGDKGGIKELTMSDAEADAYETAAGTLEKVMLDISGLKPKDGAETSFSSDIAEVKDVLAVKNMEFDPRTLDEKYSMSMSASIGG